MIFDVYYRIKTNYIYLSPVVQTVTVVRRSRIGANLYGCPENSDISQLRGVVSVLRSSTCFVYEPSSGISDPQKLLSLDGLSRRLSKESPLGSGFLVKGYVSETSDASQSTPLPPKNSILTHLGDASVARLHGSSETNRLSQLASVADATGHCAWSFLVLPVAIDDEAGPEKGYFVRRAGPLQEAPPAQRQKI